MAIVCALDNQIFYGFIITSEEQKGKQLLFQKTKPPQRQIVGTGCKNTARTTADCITCPNLLKWHIFSYKA